MNAASLRVSGSSNIVSKPRGATIAVHRHGSILVRLSWPGEAIGGIVSHERASSQKNRRARCRNGDYPWNDSMPDFVPHFFDPRCLANPGLITPNGFSQAKAVLHRLVWPELL
jgi:hypothetical protein